MLSTLNRDCSADRSLTVAAASSVLFGLSPGSVPVASGGGCLCLAPHQHRSYLRPGVPSNHCSAMSLHAHRSAIGVDPAYLSDFGKTS